MVRYRKSNSAKALGSNLDRAGYFLKISAAASGSQSRTKEYLELPRASLVFAIGSFDAYMSEISADVLTSSLRSGSQVASESNAARAALQAIAKAMPTLTLEAALMEDTTKREEFVRSAVVDHFHNNVTNHGKKAIDRTVEIVDANRNIGGFWDRVRDDERCKAFLRKLRRRIQSERSARNAGPSNAGPREFPSKLSAPAMIDYWTLRRHRVVHQGETVSVWRDEASACIDLVALLGDQIDRLAQAQILGT